jgi:hypothetical protein
VGLLLVETSISSHGVAQLHSRRPIYIVNGERYCGDALRDISPADIAHADQLPIDEQTIAQYGDEASNGVILLELKYDTRARFLADSISFNHYVASRIQWDDTDPVARVAYRYQVATDGSVVLTEMLESTDARLRRKVLKVIANAPLWSPATKAGKPVVSEHVLLIQLPEGKPMPPERTIILR